MDDNEYKSVSPIDALAYERFKGKTYAIESVVVVGTARSELLRNNPNRFFWIAINEGAADVRLSTSPDISSASGWLLPANGGVISMFWEQDGESVCYSVFAISAVAGQNVRIREVARL